MLLEHTWGGSASSRAWISGMNVAEQYGLCAPFFERVQHAPSRTLMLDYDGTLAPFTTDRMRAFPYRGIPELISQVMQTNTRVVLVSGRSARELLFLSGINPQPEIWGSHGAERLLQDGSYEVDAPAPDHRQVLQTVKQALVARGLRDRFELKPRSIAVHWRGLAPAQQAETEAMVRSICEKLARDQGMELLPFDGGLELFAPGKNKGDAVRTIMQESGQETAAAYLGDDQTDEKAFRAIKGKGLAVLVRSESRPSLADIWIKPPDEVERFLRDWIQACGGEV